MKKIYLLVALACIVLLSGCSDQSAITSQSPGMWSHFFVYPMSEAIIWTAKFFQNDYGIAIILLTIIVRVVIFPLIFVQQKNMSKMQLIQPELKALQQKYNSKDAATQRKLQEETMHLYQTYKFNPAAGCLPLLVQMPIFFAFYAAIRRTQEIHAHSFLWFQLGVPDKLYILPILAALTTLVSLRLSQTQMADATTQQSMKIMQIIMPFMIFFGAKGVPAALSLYWVISGLMGALQTLYLNHHKKTNSIQQQL